MSTYLMITIPL